MENPILSGFQTLAEFLTSRGWQWPAEWFVLDAATGVLDEVYVVTSRDLASGQKQKVQMWLAYAGELALRVPGFDLAEVVLPGAYFPSTDVVPFLTAEAPDPYDEPWPLDYGTVPDSDEVMIVYLYAEYILTPEKKLVLPDFGLALRLKTDLLKTPFADDPYVEISARGAIEIDGNYDLHFEGFDSFSLGPTLIGETGVSLSADDVKFDLSRMSSPPEIVAAGFDESFVGVFVGDATLRLPAGLTDSLPKAITLTKTAIGSGGVSGTATVSNPNPVFDEGTKTYSGDGAGRLCGIPFWLTSLSVTLKKNAFVSSSIVTELFLPYFEKRVTASFGFDGRGGLTMQVTGVVDPKSGEGYDSTTGLLTLSLEGVGVFTIKSFGLEVDSGKASFRIGAAIKPKVGGLDWPSFEITELVIDSDGNIRVDGGWIDLPKQLTLDLHGFAMELTRIGFGVEDDGQKWIGFSGGVKLVDGLQAGASVKGLRVRYGGGKQTSLSLEGVAVNLEIKDTVVIAGEVALAGDEFRGGVKLALPKLNFEFDGQFVAGTRSGQKYFAIYLHTELPAGVPLGNTGLALFGAAGLYAHRMIPNKTKTQGWYENTDGSAGWYLQSPVGIEHIANKWTYDSQGMAFGAGVTIGTFADNGFDFNGRLLLVLVFPGPIIILEGKANLFKERAALAGGGEPMFRALAILDPSQSFLIDMDARFKYKPSDGKLLDLQGSTEAFFDFNDPDAWHIWIGRKDDKKRRVGGTIFNLFDVAAYFQLNARQLDVGSSWSFDKSYGFKHLNVHVVASFAEDGSISWHPAHFSGSMSFQGRAELRAFGCGMGINVGTTVSGEVFSPFDIKGSFHVGINFPWPLPDVGGTINLGYKEKMDAPALLPLPLQEASAEIPNRSLRWPFRRDGNLVPNNDQSEGEFASPKMPGDKTGTGAALPTDFDLDNALCIPVDAQLGLTFGRPVNDPWRIGGANPQQKVPPDVVGDPVKQDITKGVDKIETGYMVSYALSSLVLEKVAPIAPGETPLPSGPASAGWVMVAKRDKNNQSGDVLGGAWTLAGPTAMPEDQEAAAKLSNVQSKLMLGAKSPFEYTDRTSQSWEEWFTEQAHPSYPCVPPDPTEKLFAIFEDDVGTSVHNPYHFEDPAFTVTWQYGGDIAAYDPPVQGVGDETIDRGVTISPPPSPEGISTETLDRVVPPSGLSEVDIRVGFIDHVVGYIKWGRFGNVSDPQMVLEGALIISTFKYADHGTRDPNVPPPTITDRDGHKGLLIEYSVSMVPTEPASIVEMLFYSSTESPSVVATVELFDVNGSPILASPYDVASGSPTVRLSASGIAEIVVTASSTDLRLLLETILVQTPVHAMAECSEGLVGPFSADQNGMIKVKGINLRRIYLGTACGGQFVVLELSIPSRRIEVLQHTVDALARFKQAGPVFEPETNYRLTITTQRDSAPSKASSTAAVKAYTSIAEQIYFRTAGLPGIGVPDLPEGTQNGGGASAPAPLTGFENLSHYVKRTVPVLPPPAGGHQAPARAFYRAYDQSVEHSEEDTHVELMYRLGRRDLTLRLFDGNNQPLRDGKGRVLLYSGHWHQSEDPTIAGATKRWIEMVNDATCITAPDFDLAEVIRSEVLTSPSEETVLVPELLHQARLVPMLLHESFVNARAKLVADGGSHQLDRWVAEQYDTNPSKWKVYSETVTPPGQDPVVTYFVREDNKVVSALAYRGPLASIENTDHPDHPHQWSDVQVSVQIRWAAGEVGLDVRRATPGDFIRLLLNRETNGRQLQASVAGAVSVLAEDVTTFPSTDSDVVVTVVCEGSRVRIFQNVAGEVASEPIFDVDGAPTTPGTVALISMAAEQPRFTEIAVHDLRPNPSTAFRFDFITSKYTNFYHHLHGFDDQLLEVATDAGIGEDDLNRNEDAAIDVPGTPTSPGFAAVSDAESRAFDDLEEVALHGAKLRTPDRIEILRASQPAAPLVLMLRSPEPLQWERTQLVVSASSQALQLGIPGALKLAEVGFGSTPVEETVSLEVREAASLAGCAIEWRPLPDATTPDPPFVTYYEFGEEVKLGDGTAVHVYSCDVSQAPVRRPGTTQWFVAEGAENADVHFPSSGVELRLLNPAGGILHQRQFLPSASFVPVAMRAIRKPDGTALFLFAADGADLSDLAILRLSFTFSRDLGSTMPVLGQAGDRDPESVDLDLAVPSTSF